MRRFDSGYREMKRIMDEGAIGEVVLLHNVHRNVSAPAWFSEAMAVTNSFVHEIDISRWLIGSEMISARVEPASSGDPLKITMRTDRDEIVSTEVFMNAAYGYHVHAELVGLGHGRAGAAFADLPEQGRNRRPCLSRELDPEICRRLSPAIERMDPRGGDGSSGRGGGILRVEAVSRTGNRSRASWKRRRPSA